MPKTESTIFISYARGDSEFALKLAKDLRSAGADIWIDQLDVPVGERWDRAVEEALESCGRFLICLLPAADRGGMGICDPLTRSEAQISKRRQHYQNGREP